MASPSQGVSEPAIRMARLYSPSLESENLHVDFLLEIDVSRRF